MRTSSSSMGNKTCASSSLCWTKPKTQLPNPSQLRHLHINHRHSRLRFKLPLISSASSSLHPSQENKSNNKSKNDTTIVISGAGPAGLSVAVALRSIGWTNILILERNSSLPTAGAALGLWTNAWKALETLGVACHLRTLHPSVPDIQLCRENGKILRQFSIHECDGGPHEFRGVRRASLVQSLAEKLPAEVFMFNASVKDVVNDSNDGNVVVQLDDGRTIRCAAVIGCDGARSPVARALGKATPNFAGQAAIRGVASIDLVRSQLQKNGIDYSYDCIRQIWSVGPRAGMYPISDSELYWFVCFDDNNIAGVSNAPSLRNITMSPADIKKEAAKIVKGWKWGLEDIVTATAEHDVFRNRIVDRWDVTPLLTSMPLRPKISATLAGDALHPMTPNLGQGGCTALEDSIVLARTIQKSGATAPRMDPQTRRQALQAAFLQYERERTIRCLPLTVRSNLMGVALQLPVAPVAMARDVFVSKAFNASHFLDHATFDCNNNIP